MPYRVELSEEATHDLERIYRFIQRGESLAAEHWFNRLEQAIQSLADFPTRCTKAPDVPGAYQLLYGTKPSIYRIVFFVEEAQRKVFVQAVRHRSRPPRKS